MHCLQSTHFFKNLVLWSCLFCQYMSGKYVKESIWPIDVRENFNGKVFVQRIPEANYRPAICKLHTL